MLFRWYALTQMQQPNELQLQEVVSQKPFALSFSNYYGIAVLHVFTFYPKKNGLTLGF